jgi:hypothetical protein
MRTVLAVLLVVSLVAPATLASGATTAKVSIAGVDVAPSQPAPGERFTVTTTIRNAESTPNSPSNAFNVQAVALRAADSSATTYARVNNLGTLPEGASVDVPLTLSFDEPGVRELRVYVFGSGGAGPVEYRYPVVVTVREGGPQVSVLTGDADPVVGATSTVNVSVANGEAEAVRNVRLELGGRSVDVEDPTRVRPSIASGATEDFAFEVTPRAADAALRATLRYTTENGDVRTTEVSSPFAADSLRVDVGLEATVPAGGTDPPVEAEVSNFGNAPLTDVVVRAEADGRVVARRAVPDVAAESSRRVALNVTGVDEATLDVTADYEVGDRAESTTTSVEYASNPGRVELTGVDVEREDDRIHLSGSASNVGLSDVQGVVVQVVPGEGVTPARPYREYFVGTIPASDFVSFDLYANVEEGTDTVPVRVSYLADGQRRETISEVSVADLPPARDGGGDSGSSPLLLVGGAVAALVVVGLAVFAYRRR